MIDLSKLDSAIRNHQMTDEYKLVSPYNKSKVAVFISIDYQKSNLAEFTFTPEDLQQGFSPYTMYYGFTIIFGKKALYARNSSVSGSDPSGSMVTTNEIFYKE